MLKAVFYARFHPERGPSVIHQYPKAAIVTRTAGEHKLLNFSEISSYVIPAYELCNRRLAVCTNGHRVLGFPVSLEDEKYERNRFTYNVCFVLDENANPKPWARIVSKTAAFFTDLEEAKGLLQAEERLDGLKWAGEEQYPAEDVGLVYTLLKTIFTELTAYEEACVKVTDSHVLNLRLAALPSVAAKVQAWDVPLLIRSLPDSDQWTYDLILLQIHPHINGTNHVAKIAELADVEVKLVIKTVRELLLHKRVIILDIFHFQAIYALTADFAWFAKDEVMQEECSQYVAKPSSNGKESQVPGHTLITLYRDLGPGSSVKDFYVSQKLVHIDIRRFITFGVIKGFLRRIHKYAISVDSTTVPSRNSLSNGSPSKGEQRTETEVERDRAWRKAAFSSGWTTPPLEPGPGNQIVGSARDMSEATTEGDNASQKTDQLQRYLDGQHCMDEICVALHLSEKQVLERLRGNEVLLFNK